MEKLTTETCENQLLKSDVPLKSTDLHVVKFKMGGISLKTLLPSVKAFCVKQWKQVYRKAENKVYTVKPVLRGHCIKGSPVLSSHFFRVP